VTTEHDLSREPQRRHRGRAARAKVGAAEAPWLPRPVVALMLATLCAVLALLLVGMPLAMEASFTPGHEFPLAAVVFLALAWCAFPALKVQRARRSANARRSIAAATVVAAGVIVLATLFNVKYAAEHTIADRDPGIYLWLGRWLATHGTLLVTHPSASFPHATGTIIEQCPVTCDAPHAQFYVQFLHGMPAMLAIGAWIGGNLLMVKVNAILGGLALLAFFTFMSRIVRPWLAVGATAALALNIPEIYFARDSFTEILAQFLLFGGLFVLWEARRARSARLGIVAGLAIGATCMVRIDSFVYLIPLALCLGGEVILSRSARVGATARYALAVGVGAAATLGLGLIDLHEFARGYLALEAVQLHPLQRALAATGVLFVLAIAARLVVGRLGGTWVHRVGALRDRTALLRARQLVGLLVALAVVALGVYGYFILPHHPSTGPTSTVIATIQHNTGIPIQPRRTYHELSVRWLSWYLGPVALALGIIGLALAARDVVLGRRAAIAPFLCIVAGISILYCHNPNIFPDQIWVMRRFVPVVLPGLIAFALWTVNRVIDLADHAGRQPAPRIVVRLAGAGAIVAMLVFAWQALAPIKDVQVQGGGVAMIEGVCKALPPHAVVYTIASPAATQLLEPIHAFCNVPVAQAPPLVSRGVVRQASLLARAHGERLALVATGRDSLVRLFGQRGAPRQPAVVYRYSGLAQTLTRRPDLYLHRVLHLYVTTD